ncbi:YjjI family glycine radical enzyme [Oscillospiraceae bacterium MB08-C2-2]|nr:YjjI family glycine radical enzyme [Oscillospiraceae bacterium MB08-C2-2]
MENQVYDIISSTHLNYRQKLNALCLQAENSIDVLSISPKFQYYYEHGALCDMNEGHAPYRPRYVMPDYQKFVRQGSEFLKLAPPKTLDELLSALQILYHYVPSITTKPVYLGNLDELIDPFLEGVDDKDAKEKLTRFLIYCDRTIANAYSHANLGPKATRAGRLLLELEQELLLEVPNFSLKYDPDITPDDFAEQAILCSLKCGNPAIANHKAHKDTYSFDYGISSCYNVLPQRGGAYTLSRVVLPRLAKLATSAEDFVENLLPDALQELGTYMNERIRFLVEDSGYFKSDFLVKEGLVDRDRFVGMFGVAGLCDCVNNLLKDQDKRYGRDKEADDLAERILQTIAKFTSEFEAVYSEVAGNRLMMHAQAGLSTDEGVTSGVRISVGGEPENLLDHFRHSARFHQYFPTGCSDIFPFDYTANRNPAALLDIVKGAFSIGDKYCAFYGADGDLVRITGYLVKKSEMEKYNSGEVVLQDNIINGSSNYKLNRLKDRKVRVV